MVVLGIDPGTANTGYGVVARQGGRMVALDGGVIETTRAREPARGSPTIHARVGELLDEHGPTAVAVEDLYFGANARSAFAVGQARGVVMLAAGQRGIPCYVLYAAAGQGRGLRLRPRGQGPGAADGADAARARRSCRGPTTPPTRSPSPSATPTRAPMRARRRAGARRMIALLTGEVAVRRPDHVVVSCGGVGYRLAVSAETLRHMPAVGKPATLHTHLIVRDDALLLYGFATEAERDLFLMLIGVQSVGPKVALAVLSGGTPRELLAAVAAGDTARLQAVPGIGKRTAERIVVELREKVGAAPADDPIMVARGDDPRLLARDGLVGLGFSPQEAEQLLDGAAGETPEDLIAHALKGARR